MDKIIELLKQAWDIIKKPFVRVFSFVENIVNFFKTKIGIARKRNPNVKVIALRIKELIKDGDFNTVDIGLGNETIVKTFYDEEKEEIMEDLTEAVRADSLDQETIDRFGDKQIIILK